MPDIEFLHPRTVDEAVQMLAAREDARCIGGGQTLVAMLNAGLVNVGSLVAMSAIEELSALTRRPDGSIRIGAAVPHRVVAHAEELVGANLVVREAAGLIAHPAIRNFGTIGGSLAHADPASDYPAAVVAADARIEIAGRSGRRQVPAAEYFVDYLTTCLEPGELITAVELSPAQGEFSRPLSQVFPCRRRLRDRFRRRKPGEDETVSAVRRALRSAPAERRPYSIRPAATCWPAADARRRPSQKWVSCWLRAPIRSMTCARPRLIGAPLFRAS